MKPHLISLIIKLLHENVIFGSCICPVRLKNMLGNTFRPSQKHAKNRILKNIIILKNITFYKCSDWLTQ